MAVPRSVATGKRAVLAQQTTDSFTACSRVARIPQRVSSPTEEPTVSEPNAGAQNSQNEGSHPKSDRTAQRRNRVIRLIVLGLSLAIITAIGVAHRFGVQVVGVDALCPFGGIETLWSLVTTAAFVKRVAASSVILLVGIVGIAIVFRRSFCGYLCPLGALQEFFGKIGVAIWGRRRPRVPDALDRPARWLKYVVLAVFAVWSWRAAELVIRPYDPWVAYMHLTSAEVLTEFGVGLAVLGVSLVGSIVYERFFCKYLCPMGAFLAIISPLSVFKVRRDDSTCTDCKACDKACPVNVQVSTVDTVKSPECIDCGECVNACPVKDTLAVSTGGWPEKGRSVRQLSVLGIVVALFVGIIALTTATGTFAWTLPSLEKAIEKNEGTVNVEEIRGSMTFREISAATGIPESAFQEKFGVQESEMDEKIKDLAQTYGFDVHTDVREFVAAELGQTTP